MADAARPSQSGGAPSACMLVFAAAAGAAPWAAERPSQAGMTRPAQRVVPDVPPHATGAWRYCPVTPDADVPEAAPDATAAAPPPPHTPLGGLPHHDHAAASSEVRYWRRALQQRLCAEQSTNIDDAAHASRGQAGGGTRDQVAPHLLWTHVPCSVSAFDEGDAAPFDEARGAPQTQLLCVDVGGYYARCPPAAAAAAAAPPPLTESPHAPRTRSDASAAASRARRSVPASRARPTDAAARQLTHLVQHRFASALPWCPVAARASTPVVLREVWVVALDRAEASRAGFHDDALPRFIPCGASAACSAEGSSSPAAHCVRVAGYPPRHTLRLPHWPESCIAALGQDNEARGPGSGAAEAVPRPCGFKRPREEAQAVARAAQQEASGDRALQMPCDVDAVVPAAQSVHVRLLHRAFLHRSRFFSEWCCAADFDVTVPFAEFDGAADASATAGHGLYAALRRAHLVAEGRAMTAARARLVRGLALRTPLADQTAGPLLAGAATEALFADPVAAAQHTGDTGTQVPAQTAVAVAFRDLWRWWVQLGWTPALTRTPVRVRLPSPARDARDAAPRESVTELLPREVGRLLAQVAAEVDRSYIHARHAQVESGAALEEEEGPAGSHDSHVCGARAISSKGDAGAAGVSDRAIRREALVQVQQLLRFRAALHESDEGGVSAAAAGARQAASVDVAHDMAATLPHAGSMWSEAAGELAADITAVATGAEASMPCTVDPSRVASLAVPWLRGVLDAPALLLSAPQTTLAPLRGADGAASLRAWCGSDAAPLVASLLPAWGGVHGLAWMPPAPGEAAAARWEPTDAEEAGGCEVADVAELRWRRASTPERGLSEATDGLATLAPAHTDDSLSSAPPSSCGRAHREVARLARCRTAEDAAAVCQDAEQRLRGTDPLAALLFSGVVDLLQVGGAVVLAAAETPERVVGEVVVVPAEAEPADAASVTAATTGTAADTLPVEAEATEVLARPSAPAAVSEALLSRQDAQEEEDVTAAAESSWETAEAGGVTACVSDAVVRVVQQNRPVVRRMLALIQSYQAVVDDVTAALPGAAAGAAETLGRDVWRCVNASTCCSPTGGDVSVDGGAPSDLSASATAAAQRLVRTFWENVAATVRSRLAPHVDARVVEGADVPRASDDVDEEAWQGVDAVGDALGAAADAGMDSDGDAGSVTTASLSAAAFPSRSTAEVVPKAAAPAATTTRPQPAAAPASALAALDGAQAMALYMQRIACPAAFLASSRATRQRGPRLGPAPPLLRAAAPEGSVPAQSAVSGACHSGHQLWVQHTLFLLSYGLACPTDQGAAPAATAMECALEPPVCGSPPALAAFRALRGGKLALDRWIVAALEAFVQRWERYDLTP